MRELADLVESGTRVIYLAGNHDFWLGSFLDEQVGLETVYGQIEVEHQGRRLLICHGDGMISKDWNYRLLRRVLHNRLNIWLFQWFHPDFGVWLGRKISGASRNHGSPRSWGPALVYRELAHSKLEEGYDGVIFGHVHNPEQQEWGDKTYLNLGDWVKTFTFGLLAQGKLSLEHFEEGSS